ncbi:hypothetical protein JOF53_003910 [Crossiella equi]|uniref:Uncharacterized protein n=1 Tax=Crossiella equi TaxID=130796 RepID=A0ABS5AEM2_9PSEU|nr:hypothetical protein [Crossiella equi]MBP2475038.1 hypothetical protein [Crossiella equi]
MRTLLAAGTALALLLGLPVPASAAPVPLPRLEMAGAKVVEKDSRRQFVPRGANYVRLAPLSDGGAYHSTFEPGRYSAAAVDTALAALARDGYNTVRVFLDEGSILDARRGEPHGLGRGEHDDTPGHAPYLDNVADFVRRATAHRVYVQPVLSGFPSNLFYYRVVGPVDPAANVDSVNLYYLHDGHIRAKQEYVKHFAGALRERLGPELLSTVLAYQTDNEAFWLVDKAPFKDATGKVTAPNGVTYDMSVPADRQQAADASMVEYLHRVVGALKTVDPEAMTTIGFFTYHAVRKPGPDGFATRCPTGCAEPRYPGRPASVARWSPVDFVDLHVYPNRAPYSLDTDLASSELAAITKPVLLGEFGANKEEFGNDLTRAAHGMRDLQVSTCRKGFLGWLYWTFDTTEHLASQEKFFHLSDNRGAINGQLAPTVRPNPCAA